MDEENYKGDKEWLDRVRHNPLFAQTYIEDIARVRVDIWNSESAYRKLWHRLFNTFLLTGYSLVLFVALEPAFTFEICLWLKVVPFSITENILVLDFFFKVLLRLCRNIIFPSWRFSQFLVDLLGMGPWIFVLEAYHNATGNPT